MRTTVTLDDDLATRLQELARERRQPFKAVLNEAIRTGLSQAGETPRRFRQKTAALGVRPGVNLDKALQLAGELEDAETARKLREGR